MPITPKSVINTVAEQGRKVFSGATGLFRHDSGVKPTSSPVKTPAPAPRAGDTKTGPAKRAAARRPKTAKAKTAAAKAKTTAATQPSSVRSAPGTSRSTPKPVGAGNGTSAATPPVEKAKAAASEPKSS